jgi:hypothetical protein
MTKKHERDEFHLHAITPAGAFGIRKRGEDEETPGILAPSEDGRPFPPGAEVVQGRQRPGEPIYDLRPVYATTKGPAQVATDTYRKSYDRIFGKSKKLDKSQLN